MARTPREEQIDDLDDVRQGLDTLITAAQIIDDMIDQAQEALDPVHDDDANDLADTLAGLGNELANLEGSFLDAKEKLEQING